MLLWTYLLHPLLTRRNGNGINDELCKRTEIILDTWCPTPGDAWKDLEDLQGKEKLVCEKKKGVLLAVWCKYYYFIIDKFVFRIRNANI